LTLCAKHDDYEVLDPMHFEALKESGMGNIKDVCFAIAASAEDMQQIIFLTFSIPKLAIEYNGSVLGFQIC